MMKILLNVKLLVKNVLKVKSVLAFTVLGLAVFAFSEPQVATLRGPADLVVEPTPPRMERIENNDLKRGRDYPQQPPTIPHEISGYQLDLNVNKCLSCHSRKRIAESQAPMVSITHFQNRDGQFLADVNPARYFCTQCHVPQLEVKPLVENIFVDMDSIIKQSQESE